MISNLRKKNLEKQGYRLVGNHSAIKVCLWCKKAIRGKDECYKYHFYNIKSWRCIQASVSLDICNLRCKWCWRDLQHSSEIFEVVDDPKFIVDGLIEEQKKILQGFFGSGEVNRKRLEESISPKHIALSLTGEGCLYPKLPELINEIHSRNMTFFLVTNGTVTSMLKKLLKQQPTQTYITLPAPDKETYLKICNPLIKNGWENIQKSLQLLGNFDRGVIRLTLAKGMNMTNSEKYAKILKDTNFKFLELKAAMPVGYARYRMKYEQMPLHSEIKSFAKRLANLIGLKLIDEKKESRVVLLAKTDSKDRKLKFTWE